MPAPQEPVVGTVALRAGEGYRVDIGAGQFATLDGLAFEGATKRSKPNLKVPPPSTASTMRKWLKERWGTVDRIAGLRPREPRKQRYGPRARMFRCSIKEERGVRRAQRRVYHFVQFEDVSQVTVLSPISSRAAPLIIFSVVCSTPNIICYHYWDLSSRSTLLWASMEGYGSAVKSRGRLLLL